MIFYKKTNKLKSFWVEDYTPTEKEFFLSLGFKETNYNETLIKIGIKNNLSFNGSGMFGFWSDEEVQKIHAEVMKQFNLKRIVIKISFEK